MFVLQLKALDTLITNTKYLVMSKIQALSLFYYYKSAQIVAKKLFFLELFFYIFFDDQFHCLYLYAYVGIHQVRLLVFGNYERCPVP